MKRSSPVDRTLIGVAVACTISGATALAIVAIPLAWHPHHEVVPFNWPQEALEEQAAPKANMLVVASANNIQLPEANHKVVVEKYTLLTEKEKSPSTINPVQDAEPSARALESADRRATQRTGPNRERTSPDRGQSESERDRCYPGHRVERRHGWRCVYARHRR